MDRIHAAASIVCRGRRKTTIKPTGVQKDTSVTVAAQYTGASTVKLAFAIDGANVTVVMNAGSLIEALKEVIKPSN